MLDVMLPLVHNFLWTGCISPAVCHINIFFVSKVMCLNDHHAMLSESRVFHLSNGNWQQTFEGGDSEASNAVTSLMTQTQKWHHLGQQSRINQKLYGRELRLY